MERMCWCWWGTACEGGGEGRGGSRPEPVPRPPLLCLRRVAPPFSARAAIILCTNRPRNLPTQATALPPPSLAPSLPPPALHGPYTVQHRDPAGLLNHLLVGRSVSYPASTKPPFLERNPLVLKPPPDSPTRRQRKEASAGVGEEEAAEGGSERLEEASTRRQCPTCRGQREGRTCAWAWRRSGRRGRRKRRRGRRGAVCLAAARARA
eukprot:3694027-Rhodomonas_salina.2